MPKYRVEAVASIHAIVEIEAANEREARLAFYESPPEYEAGEAEPWDIESIEEEDESWES